MSQKLTTSMDSITKMAADIQPMIQTLTSSTEPMSSIAESEKALAKTVEELKNTPLSPPQSQQSHQNIQPSYTGTNMQYLLASQAFNPEVPEYIMYIENRLCIQECQVHVSFDNEVADSPKERSGSAAYTLRQNQQVDPFIRPRNQPGNVDLRAAD